MTNKEFVQASQAELKAPAPVTPSREETVDEQTAAKFPQWDILPPHTFINPRIKKTK